ncbi:hypothetical protein PGTUg99_005451 [Puccinia graminis f. sp. tritici]|uniref:Uncharacterized protein n=1 Tax=Puccinia graminis f. sp. tritici TaxID=56615 RepID=A0A5B0RLX6_PUCGR|nr:hypothetical protein PGTUg99_005451 [Puccinia graminis f. sp. tritici]
MRASMMDGIYQSSVGKPRKIDDIESVSHLDMLNLVYTAYLSEGIGVHIARGGVTFARLSILFGWANQVNLADPYLSSSRATRQKPDFTWPEMMPKCDVNICRKASCMFMWACGQAVERGKLRRGDGDVRPGVPPCFDT